MDKKDYYYAEILSMMRQQGAKDNPTTLQLGTMLSANSVKIGDLILNAEDLYIADYLIKGHKEKVTISSEEKIITYEDGLKSGDLVAVQRLQDTNMYVIVARVV
jgi:hypothetical protein